MTALEIEKKLQKMRNEKDNDYDAFAKTMFICKSSTLKVKEITRDWEGDESFVVILNNGTIQKGLQTVEETADYLRQLTLDEDVEALISILEEWELGQE